jgi:hypothetical protein
MLTPGEPLADRLADGHARLGVVLLVPQAEGLSIQPISTSSGETSSQP